MNLFGAEQVSISTPDGNSDAGPYLAPGATFAQAGSSDELGDLFAAATPLLNKIDTTNLSTVLGELAQASQGEGPKIAASIGAGTQLAGLLDSHPQRAAPRPRLLRHASPRPSRPPPPTSTTLNAQINAGLPSFNAEETDYQNLLKSLIPFPDGWPRCSRPTTPTSPPS